MRTTKTFYTVTYRSWGANKPTTAYFNNKPSADKFARRDYADKPVRHTLSDKRKIAEFETEVAETSYMLE